jgi:hypothetical protein
LALYDFGYKMRVAELTPTPLFEMSRAHLKRGAFSTGVKRKVKAPSFKTIFDWRREKGLGDESKPKTVILLYFLKKIDKAYNLQPKS